jgi:hypothetical protein
MKVFASWLQNDLPSAATVSDRVRLYINGQPDYFFGSTVTLLDANGVASTSPYWFRKNGTLTNKELAVPSYSINTQNWLRKPIDTKTPYWTEPYFDSGGGDIWMRTYSVLDSTRNYWTTSGEGIGGQIDLRLTVLPKFRIGPYRFKKIPITLLKTPQCHQFSGLERLNW